MIEKWQRIFIRKLFHYDTKRLDIEGAFRVKFPHIPKRLYKYREFIKSHKDSFTKGELWSASADKLNDPYECQTHFRPGSMIVEDIDWDEYLNRIDELENNPEQPPKFLTEKIQNPTTMDAFFEKMVDRAYLENPEMDEEQLRSIFREIGNTLNNEIVDDLGAKMRSGVGVLSLSETVDSNLMWSHYSDAHKGFVIEYDFEKLGYDDLQKRLCFPVFYSEKARDLTRYIMRRNLSDFNNLFGQYLAIIKQADWAYEKEWRIVSMFGANYATTQLRLPNPSSVILGANTKPDDQDWMLEECETRGIPVRKATTSDRYGNITIGNM